MQQTQQIDHTRPLLFFDFAHHYGGSRQGAVQVLRELKRFTHVMVVDGYGTCRPYLETLEDAELPFQILLPDAQERAIIGGVEWYQRIPRLMAAVPHMAVVVSKFRTVLNDMRPRAIWVNTQKALFVAWLAAPPTMPIVFYVMTARRRVAPYAHFAWRRLNAAVGLTENSLEYLRTTTYAHRNFHVVPYGINIEAILDRARKSEAVELPPSDAEALKLVIPATLIPSKGQNVGIRALAKFIEQGGKAHLWICGDVPLGVSPDYYHSLQRLVTELRVQRYVHFLGWRDDIPAVMAAAQVVFLPTFHPEGIPRSLLEAMTMSRPIIATRAGGIAELVRHEIDGFVVEPGDVDGMVRAMHLLSDPTVRERMGTAGHRRVHEHYTISQRARQFLDVIDGLVLECRSDKLYERESQPFTRKSV